MSTAEAQVTTGKPCEYEIDTDATHYPDHLWVVCEGTGTSLADEGSDGTWDMTISGASWGSDMTHDTALVFVSGESDSAAVSGISVSGTVTWCVLVNITVTNTQFGIAGLFDASAHDAYAVLFTPNDGDIAAINRDSSGTVTNTSDSALDDGAWNWACVRQSDTTADWSKNGSAWDVGAASHSGLFAVLDRFGLGAFLDASPSDYLSGSIAAVALWEGSKSDAEIAAIYNSGNPWGVIGVTEGGSLEFSDAAAVAPATNGYTISGTVSATATVYAVAVLPGATAPNCAQIQAGDDGDNQDAEIAASEEWTGDMADSFGLTKSGAYPRHDVYVCASDGAEDTDVASFTNEDRSPDTGQTIVVLSSVSATSPFSVQSATGETEDTISCDPCIVELVEADAILLEDASVITDMSDTSFLQPGMRVTVEGSEMVTVSLEAYYNPVVATGDVVEHDDETSHGDPVTVGADGDFSYTDTSGGQYTTIDYCIQDVSGSGSFTVPDCWSEDDRLHLFSSRPAFNPDLGQVPFLLYEDEDAGSIPLGCADNTDLQAVTVTARDSLPDGLSITDNALSGTPSTEDESGTTVTLDCRDSGNLYAVPRDITLYVTDDEVTMPDLTGGDVDAAIIAMMTARPWLDASQLTVTYGCEIGAANDDVISQSPAASETIDATESVSVVAARSSICLLLRRRR